MTVAGPVPVTGAYGVVTSTSGVPVPKGPTDSTRAPSGLAVTVVITPGLSGTERGVETAGVVPSDVEDRGVVSGTVVPEAGDWAGVTAPAIPDVGDLGTVATATVVRITVGAVPVVGRGGTDVATGVRLVSVGTVTPGTTRSGGATTPPGGVGSESDRVVNR